MAARVALSTRNPTTVATRAIASEVTSTCVEANHLVPSRVLVP